MSSKRKSIGEQVASIDMAVFENRKKEADKAFGADHSEPAARPHTGVGMVINAISDKGNLERKLSETEQGLNEAQQRLAEFQEAELVLSLDPTAIRRSQWANRDPANFVGETWEAFKEEILNAGGNVEPIKVRRAFYGKTPQDLQQTYELVFGHRRHQACLELGILVKAVVVDSMDDRTLFVEMDRENRVRQNLSAWEQGRMYNNALNAGLFPSIRQMAQELGVNLSNASRSCKLAQLPEEVVGAFSSPLVLQVRWAKDLSDALQADSKGLLERARKLQAQQGKLAPAEVLAQLLKKTQERQQEEHIEINASGRRAAFLKVGPKGKATLEFESGALDPARHAALAKLIAEFLGET